MKDKNIREALEHYAMNRKLEGAGNAEILKEIENIYGIIRSSSWVSWVYKKNTAKDLKKIGEDYDLNMYEAMGYSVSEIVELNKGNLTRYLVSKSIYNEGHKNAYSRMYYIVFKYIVEIGAQIENGGKERINMEQVASLLEHKGVQPKTECIEGIVQRAVVSIAVTKMMQYIRSLVGNKEYKYTFEAMQSIMEETIEEWFEENK